MDPPPFDPTRPAIGLLPTARISKELCVVCNPLPGGNVYLRSRRYRFENGVLLHNVCVGHEQVDLNQAMDYLTSIWVQLARNHTIRDIRLDTEDIPEGNAPLTAAQLQQLIAAKDKAAKEEDAKKRKKKKKKMAPVPADYFLKYLSKTLRDPRGENEAFKVSSKHIPNLAVALAHMERAVKAMESAKECLVQLYEGSSLPKKALEGLKAVKEMVRMLLDLSKGKGGSDKGVRVATPGSKRIDSTFCEHELQALATKIANEMREQPEQQAQINKYVERWVGTFGTEY